MGRNWENPQYFVNISFASLPKDFSFILQASIETKGVNEKIKVIKITESRS